MVLVKILRRLLSLVPLLLALAVPAAAQESSPPGPPQQPVGAATLEQLVATIQDPVRRQQLVEQLQALIAAQRASEPPPAAAGGLVVQLTKFFTSLSDEVSDTAVALVDQIGQLPQKASAFVARLEDPTERGAVLRDVLRLGGVLLAGLAAAVLVWYLTRRPRARLAKGVPAAVGWRLLRGLLSLALELAAPIALLLLAFVGFSTVGGTASGTGIVLAIVTAIAAKWIAKAALGSLLAPAVPALRIAPMGDELAQQLARSLDRLLSLGIYGYFALGAVAAAGAGVELLEPLRSLYGLVLLFAGAATVIRYRRAGRAAAGAAAPPPDAAPPTAAPTAPSAPSAPSAPPSAPAPRWRRALQTVLGLWWVAALVYLVGIYTVWMSRIEGGFTFALRATALTAAILLGLLLALAVIRRLLGAIGVRSQQLLARLPILARRAPRYVDTLRVVCEVGAALLAAGLVLNAWGIAAIDALASRDVRAALVALLNVVLVVLIAAAIIDVATAMTQSYLTRSEREGRASGKVKTLIPLAQKTIKFFVVVLAGITVLSQLGMDIAPILAGVGVLGLAIGFGAQTLVKDIITGAFMLIEDAVAVGDIVKIDDAGGVVEAISIRTIRLRDLAGAVHTIPFSSVGKVTNLTKDYSRYVVECGVAYREDVDEVIAVLKELGAALKADPTFGPDMIEPIEILGLDRFEDSAVIVRARLATKPGRQWAVGREFNRRLKRAFDERGIEIPFPHRTIYVGQDKEGRSPPLFVEQSPRSAERS